MKKDILFLGKGLDFYIGRTFCISFIDGTSSVCTVDGFTSAADNDNGLLSMEGHCDDHDAVVEIFENEIASLKVIE